MVKRDPWRPLALSMAIGAAYDAAFGVAIMLFLEPAGALLRLEVPDDRFYVRLNGLFLLMLAAVYGAAARHPARYRAVVWTAIVGRSAGFAYFAGEGLSAGVPTFVVLGVADLAFALAHLVLIRRADRRAPVQLQETQGT
jgi:hypothetical protein